MPTSDKPYTYRTLQLIYSQEVKVEDVDELEPREKKKNIQSKASPHCEREGELVQKSKELRSLKEELRHKQ